MYYTYLTNYQKLITSRLLCKFRDGKFATYSMLLFNIFKKSVVELDNPFASVDLREVSRILYVDMHGNVILHKVFCSIEDVNIESKILPTIPQDASKVVMILLITIKNRKLCTQQPFVGTKAFLAPCLPPRDKPVRRLPLRE